MEHGVATVLLLGSLGTVAADVISFNNTLFHVTLAGTFPPTPSCILNRDVHLLSGAVDGDKGGVVNVHVVNGTLPDYNLFFGPTIKDRGFLVHNVTAKLLVILRRSQSSRAMPAVKIHLEVRTAIACRSFLRTTHHQMFHHTITGCYQLV